MALRQREWGTMQLIQTNSNYDLLYETIIRLANLDCGVKKNTHDIKITVFNNNGKLKNQDVIKKENNIIPRENELYEMKQLSISNRVCYPK